MTYQIIYSPDAQKQLKKMDLHLRKRIISVIERLRINPYNYVIKVVGTEYFRARAGDYRIFLRIENNELQVLILKIKRRENAYDRV